VNSDAATERAAAAAAPVALADVLDRAGLQTRVDRKYLVPARAFTDFSDEVAHRLLVLEIGGRRRFGYESVYFDTADLHTYRAHRQGRRLRCKIRTRTYTDTGGCAFEIKMEGRRGTTVKERLPYSPEDRTRLTDEALRRLEETMTAYGIPVPEGLQPSLRTTYTRTTFVDRDEATRVTCDTDLAYALPDPLPGSLSTACGPDGHVLVEVKSAARGTHFDAALRSAGGRPVGLSKYCVGIALLRPEVPGNQWLRLCGRYFTVSP
jgi:hypothetical protein